MTCALPGVSRAARAGTVLASIAVAVLGIAVLAGARSAPARASWAAPLGAGLALDIDPLAALFMTLAGTVLAAAALSSERVGHRRAYFALLDLLLAAIAGTFVARDLLLFLVSWDAAIVPVALLIWQWGDRDRRAAAERLVAHALVGSALLLVGIVSLAVARGTLDIDALAARRVPASAQLLPAMLILAGLAVRLPLFPLHGWMPRAFASAPIPAAIAIGGAMCASAAYAILRIPLYLFPEGMAAAAPLLAALAAVGALYGAIVATRQSDMRRAVAFAAVSQANLVALGLFAASVTSLRGAMFAAISSGLTVTLALAIAAAVARRSGSFSLGRAGGLASSAPALAAFALVVAFAAAAVPGTGGFAGMLLVLVGAYERFPASTVVASLAFVAIAVCAAAAYRRAFQGPPLAHGPDVRRREAVVLVPLLALVLLLGVAPRVLNDRVPDNALPTAELLR